MSTNIYFLSRHCFPDVLAVTSEHLEYCKLVYVYLQIYY